MSTICAKLDTAEPCCGRKTLKTALTTTTRNWNGNGLLDGLLPEHGRRRHGRHFHQLFHHLRFNENRRWWWWLWCVWEERGRWVGWVGGGVEEGVGEGVGGGGGGGRGGRKGGGSGVGGWVGGWGWVGVGWGWVGLGGAGWGWAGRGGGGAGLGWAGLGWAGLGWAGLAGGYSQGICRMAPAALKELLQSVLSWRRAELSASSSARCRHHPEIESFPSSHLLGSHTTLQCRKPCIR